MDLSGETLAITLLALAGGYLCGSIPFGLVITRMAGLGDIRAIGSGNIGMTNVLRTGHKKLAALTLLADALKGTLPVLLALWWGRNNGMGPYPAMGAGLGAFLGHLFPVWLGFKGGKGVATYLGVLLGLAWPGFLTFAAIWIGCAAITRISSLSALIATLAVPIVLLFLGYGSVAWFFLLMSIIVYAKHHPNIRRLMNGTEPRMGEKREPAA
ncbi:glycerol-3-phosphate 1-O-acyltransferase PlsY [Notoacmeibacter sp. MSK16QG-6]|uniref:glycerol-3-phosphate 1-O-acyltransferase PlsY n=1 Tax=Notoacmeibacter sp. MSK16QG-6 TaxID=2957982 RepID=UPI0020A0299F|nr:glycerol-3-phosphate 1-O-acyltransferase PlsY [Notoacmeibacter sp. MSK16QG-6]MCP1197886.1 glycerol-3-phosphate 1-O-acyltransferase PlsY [Notoacmeibacter sp. MSK16QG-6]